VLVVVEGVALPENPPEYPNESNGESSLLSFVVHLWKEESSSGEHKTNWRGHITPVPDGKRYYFTNIGEILDFIVAHLKLQK
jgi:hypothetical protein